MDALSISMLVKIKRQDYELPDEADVDSQEEFDLGEIFVGEEA